MKVQELTTAIIAKSGITVPEGTVDRLIAGNYDAEITGIATTFMATVDVLRQAKDAGINTIITHEPTYYTHKDSTDWISDDPIGLKKTRLIEEGGFNIWRFHDHTHYIVPDLIYQGMTQELGWDAYVQGDQRIFDLPEQSVKELASHIKHKLGISTIRLVGNENTVCKRAGFLLGALSLGIDIAHDETTMQWMQAMNIDVLLCGEMLEWTSCAYVRDAGQLGENKAMLILGHNRSEEAAMKHLVTWLQSLCAGISISFIEAGEPFVYL